MDLKRLVLSVALSLALGLSVTGAAFAQTDGAMCSDPAEACEQALDPACLSRVGAGSLPATPAAIDCSAQFDAYRGCLADTAARCGATRQISIVGAVGPRAVDACIDVASALRPLSEKTSLEARALVMGADPEGRYSLPAYFYQTSAGNAAFDLRHEPILARWRDAASAAEILLPGAIVELVSFFDRAVTVDIGAAQFVGHGEFLAWLETFDEKSQELQTLCRRLAQ